MQIYNTKTRTKETFTPLREGKVGIYVCGPTVYNYFHIGNARMFVDFDTLRRYLLWRGYDVTYVQNFTDIDDKMINVARESGVTVPALAARFIAAYDEDAAALNIMPADVRPRATEHIAQILALIGQLMDKGMAYAAQDGVYFDTAADPAYGNKLSAQRLEEREAGARIVVDDNKKHPADFALWKNKKEGEPSWPSPWGEGRPGWHIECSAMSMQYLGATFDIHAGGEDLIFPHHENEIAQSENATGKPFVNYWMHNAHLNVDDKKMSKSAGNFFTVRDIAKTYDPEAVRLFLLSSHYRSPMNFSQNLIEQAMGGLQRLRNAREAWETRANEPPGTSEQDSTAFITQALPRYKTAFTHAMDDDLNTAAALGVLFDLVREGNTCLKDGGAPCALRAGLDLLLELGGVLGLLYHKADALPADILAMADARQDARAQKDWTQADQLRDAIAQRGYVLEDTPKGYIVKRK